MIRPQPSPRLRMASDCRCAGCAQGLEVCYCPLDRLMGVLSGKYALAVFGLVAEEGALRYSDLKERFRRMSPKTLSNRLSELVDAGLLERRTFEEVPPRVEYALTGRGRDLHGRLSELLAWTVRTQELAG